MNTWTVLLKFPSGGDQKIELVDARAYFNGYLKLKRNYFTRLIKAIKMTKTYTTGHAIEEIIGNDGKNWTNNPWLLLIVKDNEINKRFWFLIRREKDLTGILIAIGPEEYVKFNNDNLADIKHNLKGIINYIITYINKFSCVVFLPNYLSSTDK